MKLLFYILSILLMSFGLTFIFVYTNLYTVGYHTLEYLSFLFTRMECISFFIGFFLLCFLCIKKR